jgi:hypothetical protein
MFTQSLTRFIRFSADDETGWDNAHTVLGWRTLNSLNGLKVAANVAPICQRFQDVDRSNWSNCLYQLYTPRWRYSSLWTD